MDTLDTPALRALRNAMAVERLAWAQVKRAVSAPLFVQGSEAWRKWRAAAHAVQEASLSAIRLAEQRSVYRAFDTPVVVPVYEQRRPPPQVAAH